MAGSRCGSENEYPTSLSSLPFSSAGISKWPKPPRNLMAREPIDDSSRWPPGAQKRSVRGDLEQHKGHGTHILLGIHMTL